ncbi:MAG: acetyltransferase [Actinomycetota bacterium]|nr:acetyltransferase [Actinomycetota bacterium]
MNESNWTTHEVVTAAEDLVIRRMRDDDDDYSLMVEWRNSPHVRRWWDPDLPSWTIATIKDLYQPDTALDAASTACIIEYAGAPIGFVQFYRWSSYANNATDLGIHFDDGSYSLDVFIGEPGQVHRGLGTSVVAMLSDYLITEMGASSVSLTTDVDNHPAQRCYEKAGFEKVKQILDTDTFRGQRVRSWLMIKKPAPKRGGISGTPGTEASVA